jgi:S-adenosyl-L-methionine hydrolase (adenosine-forming)
MSAITLLTDFGTTDSYVAEVKGVLLTRAPAAALVDISHGVPPGDVRSAAYILGRTWHRFPEGTVHLVVIDPGVGSGRAALAFRARHHFFVGPDNGVFTPVLQDTAVEIIALPTPPAASPTFHGRDVFAPAAADLARGASLSTLGTFFPGIPQRLAITAPHVEGRAVIGEVVYVDRFGTLITNLTSELVPFSAKVELEDLDLGGLKRTFSDVATGGLLAFVGSGGAIEIAVRDGSAASRLGIGIGARVRATVE